MRNIYFILFALIFKFNLIAQEYCVKTNTGDWMMLKHAWKAWWITHPTASVFDYNVFHFRKTFNLTDKPAKFIIHVSADNRYRLFVNGEAVCEGPARGDFLNWNYETIDIAPYLKVGKNVLASQVYNFGKYKSPAQFSRYTAFILQGDSDIVNTDNSWKVFQNQAYNPIEITDKMTHGFYVAGPCDSLVAEQYPWAWEKPEFNDSQWLKAKGWVTERGTGRGYIHGTPCSLVRRSIPMMEQTKQRFSCVARCSEITADEGFLKGEKSLKIDENKKVTILLDNSQLTVGYPEMLVCRGKGSKIKIIYAEALFDEKGQKGNRNQIEGKEISGTFDIFMMDGSEKRLFRPLWLRAFRYIQLEIETKEQALYIHDYYNIFTAYPFEEKAVFKCEPDSSRLTDIWMTGWHTARLCANETYWDCPYYEQLQYIGDTRIQALISLYVSGDDRLMRNALEQINNSVIPEGLMLCRAPSQIQAVIPPFSLIWVAMVHDYHMHRNDSAFVRQFLPNIRSVLSWFENRLQPNGLLGPLDWWQFSDWADEFPNGIPPGADEGNSALISLTYAYGLQKAAELFDFYGFDYEGNKYQQIANQIKNGVNIHCYDKEKQLFAETPEKKIFSQHTNIMAILTGTVEMNREQVLMDQVLTNPSLIQCTIYYKFYLMRALQKCGLGNKYISQLGTWLKMLDLGLTTFPETDPGSRSIVGSRSDCHAWSASVCYDFLSIICGINPSSPGFKTVEISPNPGYLKHIEGKVPHQEGIIETDLNFKNKHVSGTITLPGNLKGIFIWNNKKSELKNGKQKIEL